MVAVAGIRWRIEECNEQGKDLIGLDQHQVRTWTAFGHHVRGRHVRPRLRRHPKSPPAHHRPAGRGSTPGKRPGHQPDPAATTATTRHDQWRALTTVADVVTLLGAWLQPARDRLTVIRWTLWKQAHRLRAQISHLPVSPFPRKVGLVGVEGVLDSPAYPRSRPVLRSGGDVRGRAAIAERRPAGAALDRPGRERMLGLARGSRSVR